ncbi:hypothetical protein ACCAA_420054 [Candidatus Accumulibacter aalborgensis]|uniref:Uncharacterized protein n=1 Tax=Candidatus Accumulibacter aalborgensis TaxID=1860102 RepID=A0A1A8XRP0_9PROT|nr:hypothetical protein [Candidatus Accumulibacter aalborgensis]SBT07346.1 hypothetical protein ACCAA_420054 [Candidatus Accumulibacter aalborgensis]
MGLEDDEHIDVCEDIEIELKRQYEVHADLTDAICIFALESAKTAVRKQCGFAKNEKIPDHPLAQGIIAACVAIGMARIGKVNHLTLAEYLARIDKIKRSVRRHSAFGARGYYEFIQRFV